VSLFTQVAVLNRLLVFGSRYRAMPKFTFEQNTDLLVVEHHQQQPTVGAR
jgi:hypothetical protein